MATLNNTLKKKWGMSYTVLETRQLKKCNHQYFMVFAYWDLRYCKNLSQQ